MAAKCLLQMHNCCIVRLKPVSAFELFFGAKSWVQTRSSLVICKSSLNAGVTDKKKHVQVLKYRWRQTFWCSKCAEAATRIFFLCNSELNSSIRLSAFNFRIRNSKYFFGGANFFSELFFQFLYKWDMQLNNRFKFDGFFFPTAVLPTF